MARPRAKTETAISFGRTAPIVTDRINRLQVAVSNHKVRDKPPAGGAPLVLPLSKSNRALRLRSQSWDLDNANDVQWGPIDMWNTQDDGRLASDEKITAFDSITDDQWGTNLGEWESSNQEKSWSTKDENNFPFDPFSFSSPTITEDAIDQRIDAYLKKAAIYDERRKQKTQRRRSSGSLAKGVRSPLASCLSPNKNNRDRSVSFDLKASQEDIEKIRDERKERRHRLYEKKVYITKKRPEPIIAANGAVRGITQTIPDSDGFPEQEARDDNNEVGMDVFEDLLHIKSSSSSHGATEWFEQLLEDTNASKLNESKTEKSQSTELDWLGSSPDAPTKIFPAQTTPTTKAETPNKPLTTKQSAQPITSKEPRGAEKKQSFVLETVRSTGSEESVDSPKQYEVSPRTRSFSSQSSPNWKSKGRSRTDHLLSSIGLSNQRENEARDASEVRRDPEARRYSYYQKEPEGILGNQLTESSSEESSSSRSRSTGTVELMDSSNSKEPFDHIAVIDYHVSPTALPGQMSAKSPMRNMSLLDAQISGSTSASSKSSQRTGPKQVSFRRESKQDLPRRTKPRKSRVPQSDDESSVFSDLPSASNSQSINLQDAAYRCARSEQKTRDQLKTPIQCRNDDCTLQSGLGSDTPVIQGKPFQCTPPAEGHAKCPDSSQTSCGQHTKEVLSDLNRCRDIMKERARFLKSSDDFSDSPGKVRNFWETLAEFKALGSFDSDSVVKASSGRRVKREPQPFIDRNRYSDDIIISLRDPPGETNIFLNSEKNPSQRLSPLSALAAERAIKRTSGIKSPPLSTTATRGERKREHPLQSPQSSTAAIRERKTAKRKTQQSTEMPCQSHARYLSSAPISQPPPSTIGQQRLRRSDVWMTTIPEPKTVGDTKEKHFVQREMPKPMEDSVMFLMGPLMSGDTEDPEDPSVSVVTDEFTREDDNASVAAQQSCYSCGGLAFTGWGWCT